MYGLALICAVLINQTSVAVRLQVDVGGDYRNLSFDAAYGITEPAKKTRRKHTSNLTRVFPGAQVSTNHRLYIEMRMLT